MAIEVRDGETTTLSHVLSPAGVLQVAGDGLSQIGVAPKGRLLEPVALAIIRGGAATFPGLAADYGEPHPVRLEPGKTVELRILHRYAAAAVGRRIASAPP